MDYTYLEASGPEIFFYIHRKVIQVRKNMWLKFFYTSYSHRKNIKYAPLKASVQLFHILKMTSVLISVFKSLKNVLCIQYHSLAYLLYNSLSPLFFYSLFLSGSFSQAHKHVTPAVIFLVACEAFPSNWRHKVRWDKKSTHMNK